MHKEATREQMVDWLRHDVGRWVQAVDDRNNESADEWLEMAKVMADGLLGRTEILIEEDEFEEGSYYLFKDGKFHPDAYVMVGERLRLDDEEAHDA